MLAKVRFGEIDYFFLKTQFNYLIYSVFICSFPNLFGIINVLCGRENYKFFRTHHMLMLPQYLRTLNVLVISKFGSSILLSCMHVCSPLELCKVYRKLLPGLLFDSGCFSYIYWQDHFIKQGSLACCHPRGHKELYMTQY